MTRGKGLPRWLWEFVILALIGLAGYGGWWWLGLEKQSELQAQKDALTSQYAADVAALDGRLQAATASEATVAAIAFAAGIEPMVTAESWADVDRAALSLLELPGVSFVHVLAADGRVHVSSDRKWLATGRAGPRASWALESGGVSQRSIRGESVEIALPIGEEEQRCILWIGYRGLDES